MAKPRPATRAVVACQMCGAQWTRLNNLGKPKWCSPKCAELGKFGVHGTCQKCGNDYFGLGKMFCSRQCAAVVVPGGRVPLQAAYAAGDWGGLIELVRGMTKRSSRGCWLWTGRLDQSGYPVVKGGKNNAIRLHRAVVEAKYGAPLGSQSAHHICAVRNCVNPDHLTGATHAENAAEMLARRAYVARIRELEAALAALAPDHPALAVVPVA